MKGRSALAVAGLGGLALFWTRDRWVDAARSKNVFDGGDMAAMRRIVQTYALSSSLQITYFTHSFTYSLAHPLAHSFTHPPTNSVTYPLAH